MRFRTLCASFFLVMAVATLAPGGDGPIATTQPASRPAIQTGPGGVTAVKLSYRDVPAYQVLTDLSAKLGFIVVFPPRSQSKLNLETDTPVDAWRAIEMIEEQLRPTGSGIATVVSQLKDANGKELPGTLIVRFLTPEEVREAEEEAKLPPLPKLVDRPGISATATMKMSLSNAVPDVVLNDMARTFGYVLVASVRIPGRLSTPPSSTELHAAEAVASMNQLLAPMGYVLVERVDTQQGRTELHVMTTPQAKRAELEARRAMTRPG